MGRYLTLTNSKITKLGYKKRAITFPLSIGPVSLKFILISLLLVLGLFYITQSNEASIKGYKIRDLEDKKNKLILENQKLNIEIARLKSLGALEDVKNLNLVPPSKIDYLPAQSPVAVKKD